MGGFGSIWHWLFIGIVVLLLFGGRGKIASVMGDAAKGIKAFQKGLKSDDDEDKERPGQLPRTEAEKEDLKR